MALRLRSSTRGWDPVATRTSGSAPSPLFRHPEAILTAVVDTLIELGFRVTLTLDDAMLARRLASKWSQVRTAQWVDLPALLASSDLVVCHGGAGTTLAALAAGLPLESGFFSDFAREMVNGRCPSGY